jgi:hypothetical protein
MVCHKALLLLQLMPISVRRAVTLSPDGLNHATPAAFTPGNTVKRRLHFAKPIFTAMASSLTTGMGRADCWFL